ncbi:coniferyl aldehyde dehydrogenase [Vibrio genomosp. F10]|uniref:Aldehyde dehydrogenase n=1 Tax=Vibrio genomosp. F10 TaxID=723171 RepID=A0A1B9QWN0_9VIBR|nr:coniferyl aldehyde dehydrogenase [Vibrio genomosp. F10]OCH74042.1 coniferyl-aldehyde dehydrogenase [Vibrio genomosp. F10]
MELVCGNQDQLESEQALVATFELAQKAYHQSPYSSYEERVGLLAKLKLELLATQAELVEALNQDYGYRTEFDSTICDVMPTVGHINYTLKKLKKWMKPSHRSAGLLLAPSKAQVQFQPVGVVGVMVPWNFPIFLSLAPIVTAIAAGNRVMVKLSEATPHTNEVLNRVFACLSDHIYSIEGGVSIAAQFSSLAFDHLVFTGSTAVGRKVAQSAAKSLTPVTLELGGKSPVIVGKDAGLQKAIDAIMLGKSINSGQICVAPDYVFVPKDKVSEFGALYLKRFEDLFPVKKGQRHLTSIINQAQYSRLQNYIDDAKEKGANIETIDCAQLVERQMLPHILTNVTEDMLVMQEEIFGPLLPVIGYDSMDEVIERINQRPRPLALYIMSNDRALQAHVLQNTHSGGVCINDTLLHVALDDAPFGGSGESGIGRYHGIEGFKALSNLKTVLVTPTWLPRSRMMLRWRNVTQKVISRLFIR